MLFLLACPGPVATVERPNFLIIDIDSMRADRLGLQRDGVPITPNLDRLAREGVVFQDAYSQSGWTLPALLSLLSGRFPRGVSTPNGRISFELPKHSFPEILALYGYTTVGIWGDTLPSQDSAVLGVFSRKLLAQGVDPLNDPVITFLADAAEPFLLYAHALDLNSVPDEVPEADLHRWSALEHPKADQLQDLYRQIRATNPEQAIAHVTSHYDGTLAWYDRGLGRVFDTLDQQGLTERTVVIFTSEHGQELGERGTVGHHGSHYETVLHVPLVVRDPLLAPRVVRGTVQSMDLAPMVLERAGVPLDREMDGESFLALARGESRPERPVFSYSAREALSLQDAGWKVAFHPQICPSRAPACAELYSRTDVAEEHDVGAENPAVREEMATRLLAWGEQRLRDGTAPDEDPRLAEALKRGGYWGMVMRESDLEKVEIPREKPPLPGPPLPDRGRPDAEPAVPLDPPPMQETPEQRRSRNQVGR